MTDKQKVVMEQVGVFFTPEEIKALRRAAGSEFLKMSPFIRRELLKGLKKKGYLKGLN